MQKKRIGLLNLVGYERRKNIYFLCNLITHDFGIFFFKLMEFFFFSLVNTIHSALCLILLLLLALVYLPVETEHLRSIEILDEIFNLVEDYHLSLYLILCDLFILLCYIKKKNYFGSQKYILKSKIPLTVAVTVILSACHSGGPHRNNGENYQCFSR